MTQPITPTQADREAAASAYFAWIAGNPVIPEKMRFGRVDDHSMVQAFARHAAAAREEGYRAGIEAAAKVVDALAKVMPARVQDGPDYAEVFFADGETHSTHAMTMNPQDWRDLQAAFEVVRSLTIAGGQG